MQDVRWPQDRKNVGIPTTPVVCCSNESSVLEWESALLKRVNGLWRTSFAENPLKDQSYHELSLREKILLLNALCEWSLEDNLEILQYIESRDEGDKTFNPKPLGRDDAGNLYWYFEDGCWIYRERDPVEHPKLYVYGDARIAL